MKTFIKLFSVSVIIFLLFSNSYSTPLSGTYTIGSGGNYPTINSAFSDAVIEGINGPVVFEVLTGIYNEEVFINLIPGSSAVNFVTLKSQSGNPADVIVNGLVNVMNIISDNIYIENLTFGSSASNIISLGGTNLRFENNEFNNVSLFPDINTDAEVDKLYLIGNNNIGDISFFGVDIGAHHGAFFIIRNRINGNCSFSFAFTVLIEKNMIYGAFNSYFYTRITGINNFMYKSISFSQGSSGKLINNSIVGGTANSAPVNFFGDTLLNNLIINPAGGPALKFEYYPGLISDYNDYYNGGNNNLIVYNLISYNNVSDFYNATGLDQNTISQPVTFQSFTNLHLSGSSIGDNQLACITLANVPEDIDGQTRSLIHPYKGADEADFPLPVELSSFTSSVNDNNVLLNWTTASETNNSGFDLERLASRSGSLVNGEWSKVNFINGHGNSNTQQNYSYEDKDLSSGKYKYRLKQIDFNGNFEYFNLSNEVEIGVPHKFSLSQNYPNPFNPSTIIGYHLAVNSYVSLKIYDISGKEVRTLVSENQKAGRYEVEFDKSDLASGIYFYKLKAGNFTAVKKMSLLK